jgi:hypothetical protein
MEGDIVAVDGSFEWPGLPGAFESSGDLVSVLLENDGLFRAAGSAAYGNFPRTGYLRRIVRGERQTASEQETCYETRGQ